MFCLKAETIGQRKLLIRAVLLQLTQDGKAPLLCRLYMGLGNAGFTLKKLLVHVQQLSGRSKLTEVIKTDQNADGAGIKGRIHGHVVQQIGKAGILIVPHRGD